MIRQITAADYPRLMEIWESAVLHTHNFLKIEDFNYYKRELLSYFAFVSLWGFEQEGLLLGFMGVAEGNLEMLFIHEHARGKGIGKQLILEGIYRFGVQKVDVNEQNDQAVGFYQYMGFKTYKRSTFDAQGKPYPILHMKI